MYIKIYFANKPLFLCDDIDQIIEPYIHHDDTVFIDELDLHAIKTMIHEMQEPAVHAGVYFHKNLEELKTHFWKKFKIVKAGGGLVQNEKDEILFIFRRGKWDLPKGKMDNRETAAGCALREVMEETGLKDIILADPIITTYHTYHEGSRFILKETYWFRMKAPGGQALTPQTEEDITAIKWIQATEIRSLLDNSFPSIRDVLEKAGIAY